MKLTIYCGRPAPLVAVGKNQVNLLDFATLDYGWHTITRCRATRRAIKGLLRRGSIEVCGDQFRAAQ